MIKNIDLRLYVSKAAGLFLLWQLGVLNIIAQLSENILSSDYFSAILTT